MKFEELNIGDVFTIDSTPSYPKLKTKNGYIDMRDDIIKEYDTLRWDVERMSLQDLSKQFNENEKTMQEWINSYQVKYPDYFI
jgi:hypothetical protein